MEHMLSNTFATPPHDLAENSPNSARKVLQVWKILIWKFSVGFREIFGEVFGQVFVQVFVRITEVFAG